MLGITDIIAIFWNRSATLTITTHPKVNWKELESGKLWEKKKGLLASSGKKKNTYTYILTVT